MKSEFSPPFSKCFFNSVIGILSIFRNPNIISYKESFMEDKTSTLCIVMEYADGGDLL